MLFVLGSNFNVVTLKGVMGGYKVAKEAIKLLLKKIIPKNKILCEPQMGKRGLYPTLSTKNKKTISRNYMDFLQYADGKSSLERISLILDECFAFLCTGGRYTMRTHRIGISSFEKHFSSRVNLDILYSLSLSLSLSLFTTRNGKF